MTPYRLRIKFQPGNPNNRTVHVLAEVEGMLVCKTWSRRRQAWTYSVEHPYYFDSMISRGEAKVVR